MADAQSMSERFSSSPFIPASASVGAVMRTVLYALVPGIVLYALLFGWGVIVNILLASISSLAFELVMLVVRGRPLRRYLFDGSALVTAVLLALALPPLVAWWIPVAGAFVAIVAAKHLYGGLGYNAFNPAMAGYAVLLISFPREMSIWAEPLALAEHPLSLAQTLVFSLAHQLPDALSFDALTSATPLDYLRTQVGLGRSVRDSVGAPIFGHVAGLGMEWVNAGYLLGGVWLIYRKVISWHIPVAVLASLACISGIGFVLDPQVYASPLLHLFGGASMLGAFFIATDPITASTTPWGRIIYGAGIGVLIFSIRAWGGYPDGVAFAVLVMGLTVPLVDQYTVPRAFGARARHGDG